MNLPNPPRRIVRARAIPLDEAEHARFLQYLNRDGLTEFVMRFTQNSGLFLRGRLDGPDRSGTTPCGYCFVSEDSFNRLHMPVCFVDPAPRGRPPRVSFRRWKGVLPFPQHEWDRLECDRLQVNMVTEGLGEASFAHAVDLARQAQRTFSQAFNLTVDLNR